MRVLMLTPRLPYPPHRGDTLRSWQMLLALARRHTVYLASAESAAPDEHNLAQVKACCEDVAIAPRSNWQNALAGLASLARGQSLTSGYFARTALGPAIKAWQQTPFDAVLAFSGAMAPLALSIPARQHWLDLVDVDSAKWSQYAHEHWGLRRWLYATEHQRTLLEEQRWLSRFDRIWVVNQRERYKLVGSQLARHVGTLPTTIDLQDHPAGSLADEPIVTMVGSMFYPPNIRAAHWFAQHVWPRVLQAVPQAKWFVVGARPSRSVRALADQPGITVTGTVPDIEPFLHRSRVFISPVRGTLGIQSKMLTAFAAGRPCVVHADVAGGLVSAKQQPYLSASDPQQFSRHVIDLLNNRALAEQYAQRARRYVAEHYDARPVMEAWLDQLEPQPQPGTDKDTHDSQSEHCLHCQQLV
jgi:sugar transferase (PEP-CTERM/EpsH1 system associated)